MKDVVLSKLWDVMRDTLHCGAVLPMERGGSPTAKDRVYASIMGSLAVDLLLEGKTNRVVGYKHGEYIDFDINEALAMQKGIPEYQYDIAKQLAI